MTAMRTVTVVFDLGATSAVTVDVPDDVDTEAIIDAAGAKLNAFLCHQCSSDITLGDPEPAVIEEDGEEAWRAEDEAGTAAVERFRTALVEHIREAGPQVLGRYSDEFVAMFGDVVADFVPEG